MRPGHTFLLLGLWGTACATDATVGDILRVAKVDVTPANANLTVGGTLQLDATPRTESGIQLTGRTVNWSSADPSFATVSEDGMVTALHVGGPVEIRATIDNILGTAKLLISAEPITRISVAPNQASVAVGSSAQLEAAAYDASNHVVRDAIFTWETNRPSTADVTTTGIVIGIAPGGPVLITASVGGVAGVASITVTTPPPSPPVPSALGFVQQPSSVATGQPISPAVRVQVLDDRGQVVTASSASVTLRLGNNPGNANLGGTRTVPAVNGIATFSNLTVSQAGSGYTLIASSSGLLDATSASFDVVAASGGPPVLTIETQPSGNAESGVAFAVQPVVRIRDAGGTPLAGVSVTAAIQSGAGTLNGTRTVVSNAEGRATFTNLAITGSEGNRTLRFDADEATGVVSNPILIQVPRPSQLAISVQPSSVAIGQPISPAVRVQVLDDRGQVVTASSAPVTLRLGSNPGSATLGGTLTMPAVNGIATFSNLTVSQAGSGYTLIASSSGLHDATSASFNVVAASGGPPVLTIETQPSANAESGVVFAVQPVVRIREAGGTPLAGVSVTAAIQSGGGTLNGTRTVVSDEEGRATYTDLAITGSEGSRTVRFDAAGAAGVISNSIQIQVPTPSRLIITVQPSSLALRHVAFLQQPVVQVVDANGNPVRQAGIQVTASIASGPGSANLEGTRTIATDGSGVAAFTNLSISKSGSFTLRFSSANLTAAVSSSIAIP